MPEILDITDEQKKTLLEIAREAIKARLSQTSFTPVLDDKIFMEKCGLFVTLYKKGSLRGCIGQIISNTPIGALAEEMAVHAAFGDSRFTPLKEEEFDDLEIKISILTPPSKSSFDEIELGRDGVVLKKKGRSSVFLPNVATEQGWNKTEMMEHLCTKAGLDKDEWIEGATLETFQSIEFGE